MLTRAQAREIDRAGISTIHDYWLNSLFAGEPFFHDGVLVYYDGRVATLCGFQLRGQPPIDDDVYRKVAHDWVNERGAESIIFVGPEKLEFGGLGTAGLTQIWEERPRRISAELCIDCSEGDASIFNRRLYRRSRALEFDLEIRRGGMISAEHFNLIEMFYAERRLTAYLAESLFVLPAVLRSARVRLIEARRAGRLSGFAAIHKPFCDTAIGLFMMCSGNVSGVSDFLYSVMLEQARALGANWLNVGPSPSLGHFNFKVKWSGEAKVAPYYFVQWARGPLGRRFHTSWGPRILHLK